MDFQPTPLFYIIISLIIGTPIGWTMGFFDSNMRTAKKIETAESEAQRKIAEAEQKLALTKSSQTQQDDPGLLRLKKNGERFTLEVDGTLVPREISPDRKKRLIELITILRPWLEGGQSQEAASQPAAPIQAQPMPNSAQVAISRPAPASSRIATPPVPVPVTLQSIVQPKKPEPEKNIASLSIVQQIDMILQERLSNSPLAKQGIRLQESIQGGAEVYVGLNKFLAVDDVPDEEIKAAIRAAIAEWEKKYTPGL